ncbi:DUF2062 domain-containing protein [Geminocystis sp. NIES-3709]|uniref:DUF2062 domain-containing protein n=1 Tax=Geminocystis sp. NIES-3709 TaxID=1617448 RepID=UPI0005FC51C3|nr:DUF2062 domain-containing protein [Geminocystis sp. NIES-3709]BAQ63614.1 hypothetical protein GM3709_379 [Geminocystis sp. NIES-3709]
MIKTRCSQNSKKQRKLRSIKRYWQYYRLRLLRLKEHPHKIARGFAAGVFAGCFPFIGLQFVMAIIFALLIRGNKFTAILGTWISNPFTSVPLFLFNFQVGKLVLSLFINNSDLHFNWDSFAEVKDLGTEIIVTLLFGSLLVGLCFSSIAYYLIIDLLKKRKNP